MDRPTNIYPENDAEQGSSTAVQEDFFRDRHQTLEQPKQTILPVHAVHQD